MVKNTQLSNSKNYFILFIYILLTSFVMYHHELWRDEADTWFVARDISLKGLFNWTHDSGHPTVWYFILIPFAKLGLPSYTLMVVHLVFATTAAYLILFHSTFNKLTSILLIFSYYFFFEYAIICRNYAISNVLLFSIASIYPKRFDKPILFGSLVFLLANCTIYAMILASGIGLIYFIEILETRRKETPVLLGLLLIILGGLACLYQLSPSVEKQSASTEFSIFQTMNSMSLLLSLFYSFSPGIMSKWAFFSLLFIPVSLTAFYRVKKVFIFFLWVTSIYLLFFTFIYMGGHRHAGFLLLGFLFALWIRPFYEKEPPIETIYDSLFEYLKSLILVPKKLMFILFAISLLVSLRFSYQESKKDIKYSYSNAKEMAEFIKTNGYDDDENFVISAHTADRSKTILFYLNNFKKFYYPGIDSYGSYMLWDNAMNTGEKLSNIEAFQKSIERLPDRDKILFVSDKKLPEETKEAELLYYTKKRNEFKIDENYFLYKVTK